MRVLLWLEAARRFTLLDKPAVAHDDFEFS